MTLDMNTEKMQKYPRSQEKGDHTMSGVVRTREKCPVCGGKFTEGHIGKHPDLICPIHLTHPQKYYIYFYDKVTQEPYIIPRYHATQKPFTNYSFTFGVLETIRADVDHCAELDKRFDIRKYISSEFNEYQGKFLFQVEDPAKDCPTCKNKFQPIDESGTIGCPACNTRPDFDRFTWLSDIRSRKRAKSYIRKVDQYCACHFIPKFGNKNMLEVETMDIMKFRRYLVDDYKMTTGQRKGQPLSEKAVKNVMDQLRSFCIWLHKMKRDFIIPVFDQVDVPRKLPRIMPLEDREKAFIAITNPTHRAIISLLLTHTMRPSEACALDVKDFDLKLRAIFVVNGLDCDRSLKTRKSKEEYVTPLDPTWDDSFIRNRFGNEIAFPNQLGARYTDWVLNDIWKRACKRAQVPYVNIYNAMKHTTCTKWRREGKSEKDIERMSGQRSPGMSRAYTLLCVEELRHMHGGEVTEIKKAQ